MKFSSPITISTSSGVCAAMPTRVSMHQHHLTARIGTYIATAVSFKKAHLIRLQLFPAKQKRQIRLAIRRQDPLAVNLPPRSQSHHSTFAMLHSGCSGKAFTCTSIWKGQRALMRIVSSSPCCVG
jgi:hypothetical protein